MGSIVQIARLIIHLGLFHLTAFLSQVVFEVVFHEDSQTLKNLILNGIKIYDGIR